MSFFAVFIALLIEQLKPHFEKMGLNAKAIRERTSAKYAPNRAERRAMK